MLHPHGQLRGCAPVRDGLFYGGELGHAAELVRAGAAQPHPRPLFIHSPLLDLNHEP